MSQSTKRNIALRTADVQLFCRFSSFQLQGACEPGSIEGWSPEAGCSPLVPGTHSETSRSWRSPTKATWSVTRLPNPRGSRSWTPMLSKAAGKRG